MSSFLSIKEESQAEFVLKKSRFIGRISPVKTEEEAKEFIARVRKENHAATHNVPAYIIKDEGIKRYSDDGEPQGTAGLPVLDVIEKQGLTNVAIVVTRYFGGTMLGAGGLLRAYTQSAVIAIESAQIIKMQLAKTLILKMEYPHFDSIKNLLESFSHNLIDTRFSSIVELELALPTENLLEFKKQISELSSATVDIQEKSESFCEFSEI